MFFILVTFFTFLTFFILFLNVFYIHDHDDHKDMVDHLMDCWTQLVVGTEKSDHQRDIYSLTLPKLSYHSPAWSSSTIPVVNSCPILVTVVAAHSDQGSESPVNKSLIHGRQVGPRCHWRSSQHHALCFFSMSFLVLYNS